MKKINLINKALALLVLIILFSSPLAYSRQITVAKDGSGDYITIQEAIDSARDGDVVHVKPGVYQEQISFQNNITLKGSGSDTIIRYNGSNGTMNLRNINSGKIEGFRIEYTGETNLTCVINLFSSNLEISNNVITSKAKENIVCGICMSLGSNPIIENNIIKHNNGAGLNISGSKGMIRNNEIFENSHSGVELKWGTNALIENNIIRDNKHAGIHIVDNGEGTVRNNEIFDNNHSGIEIGRGSNAIIEDNTITNNNTGIYVFENGKEKAVQIRKNEILQNSNGGIDVRNDSQATISNNTISKNIGFGIRAISSSSVDITSTKVSNTLLNSELQWAAGVQITEGSSGSITDSVISASIYNGIVLSNGSLAKISGNKLSNNNYAGVGLYKDSEANISNNTISSNKKFGIDVNASNADISRNTITDNEEVAIGVYYSSEVEIRDNKILRNGGSIDIADQSKATLHKNVISHNVGYGIRIRSKSRAEIVENQIVDTKLQKDLQWASAIQIVGNSSGSVIDNKITRSSSHGIEISNDSAAKITKSVISEVKYTGIGIYEKSKATIINTEVFNTNHPAIEVKEESSTIIENSIIRDSHQSGIYIYKSKAEIRGNEIFNNNHSGVWIEESPNIVIENNTIVLNKHNGIGARYGAHATVENNIIVLNKDNGVCECDDNTKINSSHNDVWANKDADYWGMSKPATDTSVDPQFVDLENYDFHLKPTSPCIGAGEGGNDIGAHPYKEPNIPPIVEFSFAPPKPSDLDTIDFTDQSTDPDGKVVKWQWDFGDGRTSNEQNPTHQYEDDGTYTVKLTVTDNDEATDTTSKNITVSNVPPEAKFSFSPKEPLAEQVVTFDACASRDRDGLIEKYQWDWDDDGDFEESTSTCQIKHTFTEAGDDRVTLRVTLKVTDDDGDTDKTTRNVNVPKANKTPEAKFTFSPPEPVFDKAITFDASSSTDPDGDIQNYQWDFGDGTTEKGEKVSHTYTSEGRYQVKLTVTDDDGDTDSIQKELEVTTPPPEIKARYGIVIGISEYKYADESTCNSPKQFCDLKYSSKDAKAFYELLTDKNIGSFPEENVTLLVGEEATGSNIKSAFGRLITLAEEDDLVVIYYSGHGGQGPDFGGDEKDGTDEYYLPYNTKVDDLFGTAIRDDEFGDWMEQLKSKKVIIFLDSCFSGGATKAIKGITQSGYKAAPNNSVFNDFSLEDKTLLSASQENEYSYEYSELTHGVFTYYLLKGLRGEADLDNDGQIVVDELYEYIKDDVKRYVADHGGKQTPLMKGARANLTLATPRARQAGKVTVILGGKEEANKGDKVMISLGRNQGIRIGDTFEVYHVFQTKAVKVEEVRGRIEVIELVGEERALCEVIESIVPIEIGDEVQG